MTHTVPVWFDMLQVGNIAVASDGALSFGYTPQWLATRAAFPVSLSMPLADTTYPPEIISPWLANLLPEEEQLSILTRSLGLDRADTLAILAEIGGDTAGALSFGTPSDPARWSYTPLTDFYGIDNTGLALERHFEDLGRRPFLAGEEGVRLSLAGGQKKSALAVLDPDGIPVLRLPRSGDRLAIPRHGAPSTVILKPDNPNLPGITENEAFCLALARAIGLQAAEATILATPARKALCVLRYDRRPSRDGRLHRVHQEDFAQVNAVPPGRKYERGTLRGPDLATLLKTGRFLPPADALALLDQVIFNILTTNTDGHAKNYSLLLPVGTGPTLAPLYDVSSVLAWPDVTQYFAQNLGGRCRKPGDMAGRHWDQLATEMRYRPADLRQRVRDLTDSIVASRVSVTDNVSSLPASTPGYVRDAAERIETNALRIAGRL